MNKESKTPVIIAQFLVIFTLTLSLMFGAWLVGSEFNTRSFVFAAIFSAGVVVVARTIVYFGGGE